MDDFIGEINLNDTDKLPIRMYWTLTNAQDLENTDSTNAMVDCV